jgi:hypothetical protein
LILKIGSVAPEKPKAKSSYRSAYNAKTTSARDDLDTSMHRTISNPPLQGKNAEIIRLEWEKKFKKIAKGIFL